MTGRRPVAVLRPEPGGSATAARVEASGLSAIRLPLFHVAPRAWTPPDRARFDSLLLTSANAVRHAGPDLMLFAHLPVLAVGAATADAARSAGLDLRLTGTGGVNDVLIAAARAGFSRSLHLSGQDRTETDIAVEERRVVYASDPAPVAAERVIALTGSVALLHSPRAAERLASLAKAAGLSCDSVRLAAISTATAIAAGDGWDSVMVAPVPTDAALIALAGTMVAD